MEVKRKMDITELVQGQFLTATDVKNSPTKIATIVSAGSIEEAKDVKGQVYKALQIHIELDRQQRVWRMNKYSLRRLAERFGTDTKDWLGKQVALTTMLTQGGKEGVAPA